MNEATEEGVSLWPAIVLAIYWAYIFILDKQRSQNWLSTLLNSSFPPLETAAGCKRSPYLPTAVTSGQVVVDEKSFLIGAKVAYEYILTNYAAGNITELAGLLAPNVLEVFSKNIDERAARNEMLSLDLVKLRDASVITRSLNNIQSEITVRFEADIFVSMQSTGSNLSLSSSSRLLNAIDIWTFKKDSTTRNVNWMLVATDTE